MIVLLYPNRHHILTADHHTPYRQQADFFSYTQIPVPECRVIISEDKKYIFLPDRDEKKILREGELITVEHVQSLNPGAIIHHLSEREAIVVWLYHEGEVMTNLPYLNYDTTRELQSLQDLLNLSSDQIRALSQDYRTIKTSQQIEKIHIAQQVTLAAIEYATKDIRPGMREYEIAAKLTYFYESHGYTHAFDPIVASGSNACTLHYAANTGQIQDGDILLIDTGAYVDGYCGDCSRSMIVGEISHHKQLLLHIVRQVHDDCISYTRPGLTIKEVHDFAVQRFEYYFWKHHLNWKSDYFPHGIGHSIGLDVHDPLSKNLPLQEGICITIEPGLYLPEQGIGIRWENIVVITKEWCKLII